MGTGWSPFSGKWRQRAIILFIVVQWLGFWAASSGIVGVLVLCGLAAMIAAMTASYRRRRPQRDPNSTSAADGNQMCDHGQTDAH